MLKTELIFSSSVGLHKQSITTMKDMRSVTSDAGNDKKGGAVKDDEKTTLDRVYITALQTSPQQNPL